MAMGYKDIQENIETEEGLGADEAKVRQMLGELKRVEAPKNFDFAVQARIANSRPEDFRAAGGVPVFLRYAMPLALVLLVVGGFVINGLYSISDNSVPVVAESQLALPVPVVPQNAPTANEPVTGPENRTPVLPEPELAAAPPRFQKERRAPNTSNSGGGSFDSTLESRPAIINVAPRPEAPAPAPKAGQMGPAGQISVRQVLEFAGIKAEFSREGWKIGSVTMHSISARSGLKAGDLIEAINGLPVTDGTQFSGGLIVKNLRIKREGKTLDIDLK